MSSPPQRPPAKQKETEKLLETYNAREAFQILAARIILANGTTRDPAPPPRVPTETHELKLIEKDLEDLRKGRFRRFQLPSEEEARYWLKQWRQAAKPRQETPVRKIFERRVSQEVRE